MTNRPFRLGIAGVGLISEQSHIPAALGLPGVELVALIDPVTSRAAAAARTFRIPARAAAGVAEVADELDGLLIASPNNTHADLACAALERGVHVLIEKPLEVSVARGERVAEAAARAGRVAAIGYVTRFRDNVLLLKDLIDSSHFGPVVRYAYQFGTPGGWPSLSAYTLDRSIAGGGVVMVSGTHFIDRALYLFGMPGSHRYRDDSLGGPEANACIELHHSAGGHAFTGHVRLSKTVRLTGGLVVETRDGFLLARESNDTPLRFRPRQRPDLAHDLTSDRDFGYPRGMGVFQRQLLNFIAACRGDAAAAVPVGDGLASLRLIESLYRSREPLAEEPALAAATAGVTA